MVVATKPHLVILDLCMPGLSGLEIIEMVRGQKLETKFLIYSGYCNPYTAYCLERIGIHGFLTKASCGLLELKAALNAIEKGGRYFSTSFQNLRETRRRDSVSFEKILSNREIQVLGKVADLLGDEQIADALGTTTETIIKHRSIIGKKLGLSRRVDLERYALANGFQNLRQNSV